MDPDVCLTEIRLQLQEHNTAAEGDAVFHAALNVCELVAALDEWITKGGYLPKEWNRNE